MSLHRREGLSPFKKGGGELEREAPFRSFFIVFLNHFRHHIFHD